MQVSRQIPQHASRFLWPVTGDDLDTVTLQVLELIWGQIVAKHQSRVAYCAPAPHHHTAQFAARPQIAKMRACDVTA